MSSQLTPQQIARVRMLVQAVYHEQADDEQRAELCQWIQSSREAAWIYAQYMHLFAGLHWDKWQTLSPTPASATAAPVGNSPVLGFLGDILRAGGDFLCRPSVLTLLLTLGLPGVLLLVLWVQIKSQSIPKMPVAQQPAAQAVVLTAAQIAQTRDCAWEEPGDAPTVGASVAAGRQLRLRRGLVELRFAEGATVLLQGPATFDAVGGGKGFLHAGSLVAKVSKKARGFTIQTPTADVVDLGTEFGVSVDKARRQEEVLVFRGEVVLETKPAHADRKPARRHLTAGSAASVVLADGQSEPTIHEIAFQADHYVRSMPTTAPAPVAAPQPAIVADFSGGQGKSAVDQFPGIPGLGWATGWRYQEARETTNNVTVACDNPVLDGGDYLRVLIERKSGDNSFHRTIERKLDVNGPVDLKKPYVVSFSMRIDSLGLFDSQDEMLVLSNNIVSRLKKTDLHRTSGWHIRLAAQDADGIKARHWGFVSSDGKGNQEHLDSRIPVREGETYSFRISFDPPARQWAPSIAVNGGEWTAFPAMGMRSAGTAEECDYWPYLCLTWYMAGGNQGAETERIGFSVDSFRIAAVKNDDQP